jgi:anaerobic selenocysteine-containing dehydrogenase
MKRRDFLKITAAAASTAAIPAKLQAAPEGVAEAKPFTK